MSRDREDGTIWLWGTSGRPVAMLQFWRQFDQGNAAWWGAIVSLRTTPVEADRGAGIAGVPNGVASPARRFPMPPLRRRRYPAARLRQMKQLATRLTAHEMGDPQRTEFRILPTPVHRYSEPAARILDGAVFVFCRDTDPEIIVLIDAFDGSPQDLAIRVGSDEQRPTPCAARRPRGLERCLPHPGVTGRHEQIPIGSLGA